MKVDGSLGRAGRLAEAIGVQERGMGLTQRLHGPEHPDVATSLNNLARLYESMGRQLPFLEVVQEVGPLLHHLLALGKECRAIVATVQLLVGYMSAPKRRRLLIAVEV